VYVFKQSLVGVLAGDDEFGSCVAIHESREDLPEKGHYSGGIEDEGSLQSAGVVHRYAGNNLLDGCVGQVPDILDAVKIVDDIPVLDLSGQQQILKHLLEGVDGCFDVGFHVVGIHRVDSEYDDGAEKFVSARDVVKSGFLHRVCFTRMCSNLSRRMAGTVLSLKLV